MKPSTEFSCEITHHEHERAIVDVGYDKDIEAVIATIQPQNMKEGRSHENSYVKLSLPELKELVEILQRCDMAFKIAESREL